ncbi:MAG TPA: MotA/TolQ/ExbB proton channel family protein [Kofleriaceae bacterium]|nr:MotA/TolQ/ExbB proton channel family protein [Kofleriaceae bacterium]
MLYLLIGLSVISIGIIVERWWYYSRRKSDIKRLSDSVARLLRKGDRAGVINILRGSRAVEAHVILDALEYYDEGADTFSEMVEKFVRDRRGEMEGGLLFLGTLGNNAPFIGLFGTVLGIVHSFRELGAAQPGAAGGGNMDNVMNGIAEALISTAVGILVAIPAVVFYNMFSKKASQIEENVGSLENVVLARLKSTSDEPLLSVLEHGDGGNGVHAEA